MNSTKVSQFQQIGFHYPLEKFDVYCNRELSTNQTAREKYPVREMS